MTYDSFNDITLVTDSPHEMYIGWTVAGNIFPTVVAGVMGSDWVFEGDQTLNFTASSSYPISAPDLTPPSTTGGEWTATPAYDDGTGLTTFTDTKASFGAFMHGWVLMPNVEQPSYWTIFGVPPGGQTLVVQGDASYSSIATVGATYRVIAPAGIQRNTGALANIGSEGEVTWNPQDRGPSNLWAGYRHVPAMAGWYDEGETTTTGAQSGWNLTGTYHCWNRQYDPWTGRWTTPDPAASPWSNLHDYAHDDPMRRSDPSGLKECNFVIYDNTDPVLTPAWAMGAAFRSGTSIGANGWIDAFTQLLKSFSDQACTCIKSIEVWGHGAPGESLLGGDMLLNLSARAHISGQVEFAIEEVLVRAIGGLMCPQNDGLWLRQCSVAQGPSGKAFMEMLASMFNSSVSAHTHVIGVPIGDNQPGKQTLKPGEKASWTDAEGEDSYVGLPTGAARETGRNGGRPTQHDVPGWGHVVGGGLIGGLLGGPTGAIIGAGAGVVLDWFD